MQAKMLFCRRSSQRIAAEEVLLPHNSRNSMDWKDVGRPLTVKYREMPLARSHPVGRKVGEFPP
jgi:hypothetical protein